MVDSSVNMSVSPVNMSVTMVTVSTSEAYGLTVIISLYTDAATKERHLYKALKTDVIWFKKFYWNWCRYGFA